MNDLLKFYQENTDQLLQQLLEHLYLTGLSVLLACLISIPLGVLIARRRSLSAGILNLSGILQTIPSIALLGFLIPIMGIGMKPAIFALFLYSLLPILRNVYTGMVGIDSKILDAARGMGMSSRQILFKIELPLALPTIFAGIRTATVINVGVATLAAYIAAGGLGEFIFGGIALNNSIIILAGALPAALLAILLDYLLSLLQGGSYMKLSKLKTILSISLLTIFGFTALELKEGEGLKAGFPPEFTARKDGLPALREVYNLEVSHVVLAPALMYKAVHSKVVDLISGYSTDGRIQAYDLRVLRDDQKAFPPYQAAPLVNGNTLQRIPELREVLNMLSGKISDSIMTRLNYAVDEEKQSVRQVARDFLISESLLGSRKLKDTTALIIGSKIFTEQYLLSEIYAQLIESHLGIPMETKQGLGGTKILFDALKEGEIDLYPEYSGTALQVLLELPRNASATPEQVFATVQSGLQEQFGLALLQPLGFNNTYALMMREQNAREHGIRTVSDLRAYLESF